MEEKVLYSMESPFQQEINVKGYYFGKNEGKEHSACIVGALRGNEYQQLYICSKLIDVLKKIEKHGDIVGENGILVIPSVSNMSMDFGKRFWISDDTDLNRLFPGNPSGESGSRVAYAIMETTKDTDMAFICHPFILGERLCRISDCLIRNMEVPALQTCSDCLMLLRQKADHLTEQHYIITGKEMVRRLFLCIQA